ncbi:MAG: 6-pyruvoyl-tetrahydropterin synthase-related protein [Microgenomates group bacterium]
MTKNNFIIIFIISLVLGWQLLRPGFYTMHDDLQVMRLYQMDRCFQDGQLPCRWAPDLAQNYGQPLFNFYSAFPYYLGELIHLVGFSLIDTVKLLFLLSLLFSGYFTYLLTKELTKNNQAALVAAIAYLVAPYHAVDIFVRGALSESWGLALVPLVLYALLKTCRQPKTAHALLLTLSLGALLITHNITVLISVPLFVIFGLYFFLTNEDRFKQIAFLVPAILLGIGLSAFFLLPVLFEQPLIQTKFLTTDYFDFRAHFATLSQLFTKLSWGYGPSRFESYQYPETLSFFVGLLPIASFVFAPIALFLSRKNRLLFSVTLITLLLALGYLFMTHARSVRLWEAIPTLKFVQFPWRFLGPVALLTSLLTGFIIAGLNLKPKHQTGMVVLLVGFLIAANFNYLRFEKYLPAMTDQLKLTGAEYEAQIKGALLDYLPVTSKKIPEKKAPALPVNLEGIVTLNYFDHRSNYFASEFDVLSDDGAIVQFTVMFFPGWEIYQNRQGTPITVDIDNDFGLITVKLTKGHTLIQGFFENTPIRTFSNWSTFISGLTLLLWFILGKSSKNED